MNKRVEEAIQSDGGLHNLGWYLSWTPGKTVAILDGEFSVEELIAIAEYMKSKGQK